MRTFFRCLMLFGAGATIAVVWMELGFLAACAVALSVIAYLFVLGLKLAAGEIMRMEHDERPDLHRA